MSQASRIVVLLRERPHTCAEILREVPCIVHSRISELRDKGYVIAHQTTGPGAGGSLYTLLSEPDRTAVAWPGDSSGSLSGVGYEAVTSSAADIGEGDGCEGFLSPDPAPSPDSCAAQLSEDRLLSGAHTVRESDRPPSPVADGRSHGRHAGPADLLTPERCPQNETGNESAQQLSFEVAA